MIGALIARELTIAFRRGGLYLLVVAQTLLMLALVALGERIALQATPWTPPSLGSSGGAPTAGPLGVLAGSLESAIVLGGTAWLVVFCLIALPAIAGPAVASERERGTLDAVLGAGATPLAIVGAKLVAVLVQAGLLLLTGLPALGLAYVFGTPAVAPVVGAAGLLLGWSAVVAALGLLCSSLARSGAAGAAAALVASGCLFLATLGAPPLAARAGLAVPPLLYQLNPLLAALALQPTLGRRLLELLPENPWLPVLASVDASSTDAWLPAVACLALALPLILLASAVLARPRAGA